MHTYRKSRGEPLWTVGHYGPDKTGTVAWMPMKDFGTEGEAAAYVNLLNGGDFGSLKLATGGEA